MQYRTDPRLLQLSADWTATREEALLRLAEFAERAGGDYARERNYDLGPAERRNVSVLSPYVRRRLVSEAEVAEEVLGLHDFAAAQSFLQEVCWRTYWKGWLQMRPGVWERYLADVARLKADAASDSGFAQRLAQATGGETGIACFDAWTHELDQTGYLHNHARMWFASIWIYTLKLPWQLGADYFLQRLLDGDPASNTLSWRWMCGLHTSGKTYLARDANIAEFTGGRFPPPKGLATAAAPLTEPVAIEVAHPIAPRGAAPDGPAALLITTEDLSPETLPFGDAQIKAVIIAEAAPAPGEPARVQSFDRRALDDAASRAEAHFWTKPARIELTSAHAAEQIADAARGLPIVMAEAPVGPVSSAIGALGVAIAARGVAIHPLRRDWDDAFWPHASRGFFQLRAKIPETLRGLGLLA